MNKEKRYSSHFILMILSVLMIILLIVLSVITSTRLSNVSKELEKEKINLSQNEVMLKELRALKNAKVGLELLASAMEKQIPDKPSEHVIIEILRQISQENKAILKKIKFNERKILDKLVEMPLEMEFNGRYSSIISLLEKIRNGERLIRIDSIKLSKSAQEDGFIVAQITGSAFFK
ncbi:MAG: type 4a pilus biogenesis protein PilO [Clostridiaceae bacterium]|nr:type 4a pilus biogenesis protein PilO [Clostridiaceae bacterium]